MIFSRFSSSPRLIAMLLLAAVFACVGSLHAQDEEEQDPFEDIKLSPVVRKLLDEPATDNMTRRQMLVFHGLWDELNEPTIAEQAAIALARFDLTHASLSDAEAPMLLRARAALWRGEPQQTLELLKDDPSLQAIFLRARAYMDQGRLPDATATLQPLRDALKQQNLIDPVQLTAGAQGLALLARLEGRPSQDYQLVMQLLGKVRHELDPLYWPASLAEARILYDKSNPSEAVEAILDTLRLNPASNEAWYLLGVITTHSFNFDKADEILKKLRTFGEAHLLADLLEAQLLLKQKDIVAAEQSLTDALARHPAQHELLSLLAAAHAMRHDELLMRQTLDRFDGLSPGSAAALNTVGEYLSYARQYPLAQTLLREAIAREPNWPDPRVTLGMLLMDTGDEEQALRELAHAVRLDPFNVRAANQFKLAEELAGYRTIETGHFIIKYRQGIDVVLARDMAEQMEQIYHEVTSMFRHRPARRTIIEILPDERRFAVRIAGVPDIWALAATTGDVIAMSPPRPGAGQQGNFDWAQVLRHEFAHTVTLDQTQNRIPHWFTEGCAVWAETVGRSYDDHRMLAHALHNNELFDLNEISWAFVRPKRPHDRALAYAQGHWMVQYFVSTFGHAKLIELLNLYRQGVSDVEGITRVTRQSPTQFMQGFERWANTQVQRWGLAPRDDDAAVNTAIRSPQLGDAELATLLQQHPDHPDVLKWAANRAVETGDDASAWTLLRQYQTARPVDPWADRMLLALAVKHGRGDEAIAALEHLDRLDIMKGDWAYELAKLHRLNNDPASAISAVRRALHREPYNAIYRELAATIALQMQDREAALLHMQALAILEPDRAIHQVRLAALYSQMGRQDDARQAALEAIRLDANAPVQQFLAE